jgi:chromosomal replication initiator protein
VGRLNHSRQISVGFFFDFRNEASGMARPSHEIKSAILSHLRTHAPDICRHWFEDIEPIDLDRGVLKLLVREAVQLKYLQKRCVSQFTEAARAATGHLITVRFVGESEARESVPPSAGEFAPGMNSLSPEDEMVLSPDYCFENFVSGPGNQLAHAASIAVAQKPGQAYNPLFIYSGVGLGKTHLLQAICQQTMRLYPSMRICYVSCEGFLTQFMNAVQNGRMNEFRQCFRKVDMLLIDDIHDLSKRGTTQEEFFHTFNALYQLGKQIVLSSDAAPNEIPDFEERLTSRFNSGLIARIDKPCFETRVAIIKSKAKLRAIDLPEDVASYIASRIDSNIRELEGALLTTQGIAAAKNVAISLQIAKEAIDDQAATRDGHVKPTVQAIIDAVTRYYDVKLSELLSKRRHKSIATPRQIGMWLARKYTHHSFQEIGGFFGGRDHSTVMYAISEINRRQDADSSLRNDLNRLERMLDAASSNEEAPAKLSILQGRSEQSTPAEA